MTSRKKTTGSGSPGASKMGLFSWAGTLAVFYAVLLLMITIPLIAVLVVFAVRTVIDYRFWILMGFLVLAIGGAILAIRRRRRLAQGYERGKQDVMEVVRAAAREGHNVNISFMHGLVRIDYQGDTREGRLIEAPGSGAFKALPVPSSDPSDRPIDIDSVPHPEESGGGTLSDELERLSRLRDRGVVTEDEFLELKDRLIKGGHA